ncbi:MAG TPA: PIN domain-containing protein [Bryobacteraceae bacterium]|nr:PIN domain-containing protein [Bryobacteraceae bacterium]
MSLVFWDTMLFVYLLEDHPLFAGRVKEIRSRMIDRGDQLCTSAFTLGELLSGPSARNDAHIAGRYRAAIRSPYVQVLSFTEQTAEHFASIRANRSVAPADAIQLACAAEAKVDLFLTNDRHLSKRLVVRGIQFIGDLDFDYL